MIFGRLRLLLLLPLAICTLSCANPSNEVSSKPVVYWLGNQAPNEKRGLTILGLQPGDRYSHARDSVHQHGSHVTEESDSSLAYLGFKIDGSELEVYASTKEDEILSVSIDEAISLENNGEVLLRNEKSFIRVLEILEKLKSEKFQSSELVVRTEHYDLIVQPTSSSKETGLIRLQASDAKSRL